MENLASQLLESVGFLQAFFEVEENGCRARFGNAVIEDFGRVHMNQFPGPDWLPVPVGK